MDPAEDKAYPGIAKINVGLVTRVTRSWPIFAYILGDCLFWVVFVKITEVAENNWVIFSRVKLLH
jgi:hypothetical protein